MIEAIKKIEENSHISGLTDEIQKFLDKNKITNEKSSEKVKEK